MCTDMSSMVIRHMTVGGGGGGGGGVRPFYQDFLPPKN